MKSNYHFTLKELYYSSTAQIMGIDNTPKAYEYLALATLVKEVLEPIREHVNGPIIVNSGYRCSELNKAIGGVYNSQHLIGEAVDFTIGSIAKNTVLFNWIVENIKFDQCILENGGRWIHVSYSEFTKNRQQAIRA